MRGEVIAIGDEITSGQRLDTNSQWLSERLTELGVRVAFHCTVGDNLEENVAVLRTAIQRADLIVVTGGLGPTADDLTREALAQATDVKLVRDEPSLSHIRQLFASRGRQMPLRNEVQADFPAGSQPIPNPYGTAPGIAMRILRPQQSPCLLFALPGVPAEMFEMWQATVSVAIHQAHPTERVIRHHRIKCFGVGESRLEEMLPELIRRGREPTVGITVSDATITLRITATASDEPSCYAAMQPTIATIHNQLGTLVFGEEEDEIQHAVMRLLAERNQTVAAAEWGTRGLLTRWLAETPEGDTTFLAGTTVQSQNQLQRLLQKPSAGAAHESATATALAEGIRLSSGADFGIGVAAIPPEQVADAHVCVSLATPKKTRQLRFPCAAHPSIVRSRTAKQALNALRLTLLEEQQRE